MSTEFACSIKRIRFDENYQPADNTRLTTNFANLARGESREQNLRNTLRMINNRFNALAQTDNPNGDRYSLEIDIISANLDIEGNGQTFPIIEMLKSTINDHHTHQRIEGMIGNSFSSYVRDYDFSVVLKEHNKENSTSYAPEGFGDLHGKLYQYLVNSETFKAEFNQQPVFVEDAKFLRSQTNQPIKWALPGPMTMIDTLYDGHYKSREKLAWEFAKILNQEARELEAAGVDIIQFDEPAFNVFFDEVNDWGVATLERALEGLKCETAVHICYGYGIKANTDWKKTLGSEWRQYEEAFPKLQKSKIDIISLECQNSRVPMDLIELIRGKKVMVGAIDVATNTVETPEEVANTLRKALQFVDADKLYPSTNCGMAPLAREVARGKLNALSAGAEIIRQELSASYAASA
jgi:methionine synthase II (cobalamin-independent)